MSTLLVQSCSKTKNRETQPTRALDLYSGYFYKIIKKAIQEDEFSENIDLLILSAKHDLIDPNQKIEYYDEEMTVEKARERAPTITRDLSDRVATNGYDRVVINAGKVYRKAILTEEVPALVSYVSGKGIGEKGSALKRFIRGDASVLEAEA